MYTACSLFSRRCSAKPLLRPFGISPYRPTHSRRGNKSFDRDGLVEARRRGSYSANTSDKVADKRQNFYVGHVANGRRIVEDLLTDAIQCWVVLSTAGYSAPLNLPRPVRCRDISLGRVRPFFIETSTALRRGVSKFKNWLSFDTRDVCASLIAMSEITTQVAYLGRPFRSSANARDLDQDKYTRRLASARYS